MARPRLAPGLLAAALLVLAASGRLADGQSPPRITEESLVPYVGDVIREKFDPGFYETIRIKTDGRPHGSESGVPREYHHVIVLVNRHDGSGDDPDIVAERGKNAVAVRLGEIGAKEIVQAGALSFVTAHVPVDMIPRLSLMGEIYRLGDGELEMEPLVDKAKSTTRSTPREIYASSGIAGLNGTGVLVATFENMYHQTGFGDRITKHITCTASGCMENPAWAMDPNNRNSHGIHVARILGGSEFPENSGIAPGVSFLNMPLFNTRGYVHGLDRAFQEGVDVINTSFGSGPQSCNTGVRVETVITAELVDKGVVVVTSAGNSGHKQGEVNYNSVNNRACMHNIIAVGGINDRRGQVKLYGESSRGPAGDFKRLKPEIAAPAVQLAIFQDTGGLNLVRSGTSFSSPLVAP